MDELDNRKTTLMSSYDTVMNEAKEHITAKGITTPAAAELINLADADGDGLDDDTGEAVAEDNGGSNPDESQDEQNPDGQNPDEQNPDGSNPPNATPDDAVPDDSVPDDSVPDDGTLDDLADDVEDAAEDGGMVLPIVLVLAALGGLGGAFYCHKEKKACFSKSDEGGHK